jgi:N-acetyl-gamma-glutamyl-phosphate reductase
LLRLLAKHPQVKIDIITSRAEAGTPVSDMFPNLRGHLDLCFSTPDEQALARCDVVFFATPNGVAMQSTPDLLNAGVRVIDLAADFRLRDVAVWEQWYGQSHACPDLLDQAVYGLPEVNRDRIKTAQLIANPGCYPTAVQLGYLPLIEKDLIETDRLIADCKSGVSGAGRGASVNFLLCEAGESFKAYAVPGHRHLPEIRQGLETVAEQSVGLTFVPHLTPMARGIHATLYATIKSSSADVLQEIQQLYEDRYRDEPFVDVLPVNSHPETRSVRGSNTCRIAIHRPQGSDTLVILSAIDNLVKGAAGQAVQNLNIMFGLDESTGLDTVALVP